MVYAKRKKPGAGYNVHLQVQGESGVPYADMPPGVGQPAIMWNDTKLLHTRKAWFTKKGKTFTRLGKEN